MLRKVSKEAFLLWLAMVSGMKLTKLSTTVYSIVKRQRIWLSIYTALFDVVLGTTQL
jgi:hypothetical protein